MSSQLNHILERLNPGQLAAATAESDTLVWAGPGSGKTQVAAGRAGWLIQTGRCLPHELLVVTFTNRAVNEFRQRLETMLGAALAGQIRVSTFHSLALSLIEMEGQLTSHDGSRRLRLISSEARQHLLEELIEKTIKGQPNIAKDEYKTNTTQTRKQASEVGRLISQFKTDADYQSQAEVGQEGDTATFSKIAEDSEPNHPLARAVYPYYRQHLSANRLLDLDDLIPHATTCLKTHPKLARLPGVGVRQVLLDETQDTAPRQLELLLALMQVSTQEQPGRSGNRLTPQLVAVGDERQQIFTYLHGGAYASLVQALPQPAQLHLEVQYRYGPTINRAAQSISWHLGWEQITRPARLTDDPTRKYGGFLETTPTEVGHLPITVYEAEDEAEEGAFLVSEIRRMQKHLPQMTIAVLVRTHRQAHYLSQLFSADGLAYRFLNSNTEVEDGFEKKEASGKPTSNPTEPPIQPNLPTPVIISTIHAAKGAEFEVVFVPGLTQGLFPVGPGRLLEDLRLFFVAITRAKYLLYLSYPLWVETSEHRYDRRKWVKPEEGQRRLAPSSFLSILP
ncbi:MAG TPA: ATP-dependent helicase [Chloroflexia bacterium]|nr:ATP-dependent helicase [Chloroflexia bacterium]